MDENRRQPEEHEVLAEIHAVISNNPDFGSKRVATSIKNSNPDWHIGDKRVNKILKKYKSSMSSEDSGSSPWNVAPAAASTSSEDASPWAVSPFQTVNPFKSPGTPPPSAEAEPEPDVVSSAVMEDLPPKEEPVSSAFSSGSDPTKQGETPATSSAWTATSVAETEQSYQTSAWTLAATETVEQVQGTVEETVGKEPVQKTEEVIARVEEEGAAEAQEEVVEKEAEPEVQQQVEESTSSAWTSAPVQKEVPASAWTMAPVEDQSSSESIVEEVGAEKAVVEDGPVAISKPAAENASVVEEVIEEPTAVEKLIAPVKESAIVEEIAIPHKDEEAPAATSSVWTTAPVQVEEPASGWTTAPVQDKAAAVEEFVVEPALKEEAPAVTEEAVEQLSAVQFEPKWVVEAAAPETEVGSAPVEEPPEEKPLTLEAPAASPWTAAPMPKKVVEVPAVVAKAAAAEKTSAPVVDEEDTVAFEEEQNPAPVVEEISVKEEDLATSAWNSTPFQEKVVAQKKTPEPSVETPELVVDTPSLEVEAPVKDEVTNYAWNTTLVQRVGKADAPSEVVEPVKAAVEEEAAPATEVAAVVEAKVEDVPIASSAWNTTPVQESAAFDQKEIAVVKKTVVETKAAPVAADKEVVVATEAVVEDAKIDKKTIANAFDGVASYKVDSVSKIKKVPSVEAAVAKSADTPGACGACGIAACSIM